MKKSFNVILTDFLIMYSILRNSLFKQPIAKFAKLCQETVNLRLPYVQKASSRVPLQVKVIGSYLLTVSCLIASASNINEKVPSGDNSTLKQETMEIKNLLIQ